MSGTWTLRVKQFLYLERGYCTYYLSIFTLLLGHSFGRPLGYVISSLMASIGDPISEHAEQY